MNILITGGGGLLGGALSFELAKRHSIISGYRYKRLAIRTEDKNSKFEGTQRLKEYNRPGYNTIRIDIQDKSSLTKAFELSSPDLVIHAAALTDLEFCEKHPEKAHDINVKGTDNVVKIAMEYNSKIVYICTDYIFDGEKGNYSETDKPNPLSVYARTKLEGENIIADYDKYISIRTSMYGWSPHKTSFSSMIIEQMRANKKIYILMDQISSPLFTNTLAEIIERMFLAEIDGIYNIGSSEQPSKYDFALKIAEFFNLDPALIEPISLDELMEKYSLTAKRPKNVSLNVSKIERDLAMKMPNIQKDILDLKNIEKDFKERVVLEAKTGDA